MRGERREALYYGQGAHSPSSSSSSGYSSSPPSPHHEGDAGGGVQGGPTARRPPFCPPLQPSLVTSRPVNVGSEAQLLQRDCQFVKKAMDDGGMSTYVTGDQLGHREGWPTGEPPKDPRHRRLPWTAPMLRPVLLRWDEATSRGPPPPRELLIEGISLPSKALLVTLMEAATGMTQLGSLLEEVQLAPGCALLTVRDPGSAVCLLKQLMGKSLGTASGEGVRVKFDPGGRQFARQKGEPRERIELKGNVELKSPEHSVRDHHHSHQGQWRRKHPPPSSDPLLLTCSRRVPCLLIDYGDIPAEEPATSLEEIFCKCRIFNVERAGYEWHVHLASQAEIEQVRRWRGVVTWQGKPVPFAVRVFERPPNRLSEGQSGQGIYGGRGGADSPRNRLAQRQRTSVVSLDELYGQQRSMEERAEDRTMVAVDEPTDRSLPIFNRRYLERSRMARSQARPETEESREEVVATKVPDAPEEGSPNKASSVESLKESPSKGRRQSRTKRLKTMSSVDSQSSAATISKVPSRSETPRPRAHPTGCARTEGYYQQRPEDKVVYWEDSTKGMGEDSHIVFDPRATPAVGGASAPAVMTGRSARAQNRRLHWETSSAVRGSLATADYFAKTTALAARKKKLILGRSSIHSWGLFAGEDVEAGDMVVEYVGEIIRHSVANVRERKYELALQAQGSREIASSYFFRLDTELVLDATHKGNLSRFINHSCDPSCVARVMTLDGARRIIMYARREIRRGEELTYDYKFPLEDDPAKKITCLCGARNCRGTLN